jgi:hypothetical protein
LVDFSWDSSPQNRPIGLTQLRVIHAKIDDPLVDAMVCGLRELPPVHLAELPRMAD